MSASTNLQITLYDALVSINVPAEKARAVMDAMERDMMTVFATKADIKSGLLVLDQKIELLRKDMEILKNAMTIRLGSIQVVTAGLLFAALKLT